MKDRVTLTIDRDVLALLDSRIDGVKIKNRSHAVELFLRKALKGDAPDTAVILAGGKGSRLKPLTKNVPKSLVDVGGKPILWYNIMLCKRHGMKNIILSLGHMSEKIEEYIEKTEFPDMNITVVKEQNPLGTAGPIRILKEALTGTFVLMNGDELKNINITSLFHAHIESNAEITISLTTVKDPSGYGVALLDGNKIVSFVEKPKKGDEPSRMINAGLYIVEPEVIALIPRGYAMVEYDLFPKIAKRGGLFGYHFSGQWYSADTPERLKDARANWKGFSQ